MKHLFALFIFLTAAAVQANPTIPECKLKVRDHFPRLNYSGKFLSGPQAGAECRIELDLSTVTVNQIDIRIMGTGFEKVMRVSGRLNDGLEKCTDNNGILTLQRKFPSAGLIDLMRVEGKNVSAVWRDSETMRNYSLTCALN
ncbi:MAG: hypothetical protein ABL958_18715 [Bdellovibrionia bacterium]